MENIVKDLEPMLRELAEKLGTTSEYLWTVTVKQAFISGIYSCIAIVGVLIGIALYIRLVNIYTKKLLTMTGRMIYLFLFILLEVLVV